MTDRTTPAMLLAGAYAAAVAAKDVDALTALYDPAVRVFDLWGRWSFEGRAAWRAAVEEWLGSLGEESVRVDLADVQEMGSEGVAVVTAFVRYANLASDGAEQRAMQNRLTWVVARQADGACRIVHEHTSAPVDPESGKVILRRPAQPDPTR